MQLDLGARVIRKGVKQVFLALGILLPILGLAVPDTGAAPLDGITIIKYTNEPAARQTIAEGSHLVMFISSRGSYAAVVANRPAHYSGCTSLAVPGSYSGTSIAFGMDAGASVRKQRLQTYCPPFTVRLKDTDTVLVEAANRLKSPMKIVAHIPFSELDFSAPHFTKHNIKEVRLGPVKNSTDLSPLGARGYGVRKKRFQHVVGQRGNYKKAVQGYAAASEITGWPWDVLYSMRYLEQFPQTTTFPAFYDAVLEKYGEPSSKYKNTGYMLWFYDMAGQKIDLKTAMSNSCRSTLEFRLKFDKLRRAHGIGKAYTDLNFWGCSLVMELRANKSSGGVTGYAVEAFNGYVMAVNYFYQQIDETEELKKKIEALQGNKPQF